MATYEGLTTAQGELATTSPSSPARQQSPQEREADGHPGGHQFVVGGQHIPPTPVEPLLRAAVGVSSLLQTLTGVTLTGLGIALSVVINHRAHYRIEHPALWWCGAGPIVVGTAGLYAVVTRNREHLYRWGLASILVALTQTALMGVLGAYIPALYNAWPYVGTNHQHPICEYMVDRCYCQDYYHGKWSKIKLPGVQYIVEDVKWKDTGFVTCDDVQLVSCMYYADMAVMGLFLLATVVGWIISLAGSICTPQKMEFQRLEEVMDAEEGSEYMESAMMQQRDSDKEASDLPETPDHLSQGSTSVT